MSHFLINSMVDKQLQKVKPPISCNQPTLVRKETLVLVKMWIQNADKDLQYKISREGKDTVLR